MVDVLILLIILSLRILCLRLARQQQETPAPPTPQMDREVLEGKISIYQDGEMELEIASRARECLMDLADLGEAAARKCVCPREISLHGNKLWMDSPHRKSQGLGKGAY